MKIHSLVLLTVFGLISCDESIPPVPNNSASGNLYGAALSASSVRQKFVQGSEWRIERFTEEGSDYSARFSEYSFDFEEDSRLIVRANAQEWRGTYRVFTDDNQTELAIILEATGILQELNDDWYIISASESTITMRDGADEMILIKR